MDETPRRVLRARAHREGGRWWTITIPELTQPGPDGTTVTAVGAAVSASSLASEARDLAAAWLDVDPGALQVQVEVEVPAEVRRLWDEGARAEVEAREAVRRAALLRREAVHRLREQGYTLGAAAAAFSISYQRAQQLAAEADGGGSRIAS